MNGITADYWEINKTHSTESKENKDIKCTLCPNYCVIRDGSSGACRVRYNENGKLFATAYGKCSSIALDPVEKKPLYKFHSGKMILSVGSYGCNFHCPFCQNYSISLEYECDSFNYAAPEEIAVLAKRYIAAGNIGAAYTYNEPIINYEYVRDCCKLLKREGLLNVLVTNGYINEKPLVELLPYIDAMNIDIKGDNEGIYKTVGGKEEIVKQTIETSIKHCHIEVTTLVIPGENEDSVENIAKWLASIDKRIPYHLTGFFPRYKYSNRKITPSATLYRLKETASMYLENVYLGNI